MCWGGEVCKRKITRQPSLGAVADHGTACQLLASRCGCVCLFAETAHAGACKQASEQKNNVHCFICGRVVVSQTRRVKISFHMDGAGLLGAVADHRTACQLLAARCSCVCLCAETAHAGACKQVGIQNNVHCIICGWVVVLQTKRVQGSFYVWNWDALGSG